MNRIVVALFALLFVTAAQAAEPAPASAHPAMWRVQGRHSTVYLLGSVHILAPGTAWRDARIARAIEKADTFYFETAVDQQAIVRYMAANGTLPPGQSLRALLPPKSQTEFDDALQALGVPQGNVYEMRPWLAMVTMLGLQMRQAGLASTAGVDIAIMADAKAAGKPIRYFETIEQQLALLAPSDPALELQGFESFLDDFKGQVSDIAPMTDAWAAGDHDRLAGLLLKDFDNRPGLRKTMLDDRNAAWVKTLESVLDNEHGTFLVTVGAGHLLTDRGVPELLRRDGYRVREI